MTTNNFDFELLPDGAAPITDASGGGGALYERREYCRYSLEDGVACTLYAASKINEVPEIPAQLRDISRAGMSLLVGEALTVPSIFKLKTNVPTLSRSLTMLAKSLSCVVSDNLPDRYFVRAKFVGLLPPEVERVLDSLSGECEAKTS